MSRVRFETFDLEPHRVPVAAVDASLSPVPLERLHPQALRMCFAPMRLIKADLERSGQAVPASIGAPELLGDQQRGTSRPLQVAAVLVPLVLREGGLTVLLTRRAEHLSNHAGQISFPGGRTDPDDVDAVATALREAREEVGIMADEVEVLGVLPPYVTLTAYEVTPVIGLLAPPRALKIDASEVAEIFEVPLEFLMNPAHHRHHVVQFTNGAHQFMSMPWRADSGGDEYFIWGATAAMLRNLYHFLMR